MSVHGSMRMIIWMYCLKSTAPCVSDSNRGDGRGGSFCYREESGERDRQDNSEEKEVWRLSSGANSVATTVIEVMPIVPEATMMIILMHSNLGFRTHQPRPRGRSNKHLHGDQRYFSNA